MIDNYLHGIRSVLYYSAVVADLDILSLSPHKDGSKFACTRSITVNGAGNLDCELVSGNRVTIPVLAGKTYLYQISKIYLSATTATGLILEF